MSKSVAKSSLLLGAALGGEGAGGRGLRTTGPREEVDGVAVDVTAVEVGLVFDGIGFHQQDGRRINARHHNRKTTNFLFADGHVDNVPTKQLPQTPTSPSNSLSAAVNDGYKPKLRLDQ